MFHKLIPFIMTQFKYPEKLIFFTLPTSSAFVKTEFNIDYDIEHKNGLNCKCQGNIFGNNNAPLHY